MISALNIACLLVGFVGMELVAWATHKYVMHGFLWLLHKDHHKRIHHPFEWNDLFFVIFAGLGIFFILKGIPAFDWHFFLGLGISLYGMAYLFVHDIFVHKRIKLVKKIQHPYFEAVQRAHKAHHSHADKEHGESFGFLWVPMKYWENKNN